VNTQIQDALLRHAVDRTRGENATVRSVARALSAAGAGALAAVRASGAFPDRAAAGEARPLVGLAPDRLQRLGPLLGEVAGVLRGFVAAAVRETGADLWARAALDLREVPAAVRGVLDAHVAKVQEAELTEDKDALGHGSYPRGAATAAEPEFRQVPGTGSFSVDSESLRVTGRLRRDGTAYVNELVTKGRAGTAAPGEALRLLRALLRGLRARGATGIETIALNPKVARLLRRLGARDVTPAGEGGALPTYRLSLVGLREAVLDAMLEAEALLEAWDEAEHPRGVSGEGTNAGSFTAGGGSESGIPPPYERRGSDLGMLYHSGPERIEKIDPTRLQSRDYGFYGPGFYASAARQQSFGRHITRLTLDPSARVLMSDHLEAAKRDRPELVRDVARHALESGLAAARARGKEAAHRELAAMVTESPIEWKNAVTRFAADRGYDVVHQSPGEIVIRNLGVIRVVPKRGGKKAQSEALAFLGGDGAWRELTEAAGDPLDLTFDAVPDLQLAELLASPLGGALYETAFADLGAATLAQVRGALTAGLAQGKGVPFVARLLQGILGGARWKAERIVRSEYVRVAGQAALATYAQNPDLVSGVQWVATLDGPGKGKSGTCLQCGVLDGRVWTNLDAAPRPVTDTHPG